MPYRVRIRRFLNVLGYHAGAYVIATVEDSSRGRKPEWRHVDIDLTLADCGRVVSFDFDLDTKGARRNSLRKVDIMVEVLTLFREALQEEARLAASREDERRKNRARDHGQFDFEDEI